MPWTNVLRTCSWRVPLVLAKRVNSLAQTVLTSRALRMDASSGAMHATRQQCDLRRRGGANRIVGA